MAAAGGVDFARGEGADDGEDMGNEAGEAPMRAVEARPLVAMAAPKPPPVISGLRVLSSVSRRPLGREHR